MQKNPYAPDFEDLPQALPVFPLEGVLLLPGGTLPLNIFEPRYLAMVEAALSTNRLIGMIQPRPGQSNGSKPPALHSIGCAGKITEFSETGDGRYLITLSGISRFRIALELEELSGYRRVTPAWDDYKDDLYIRTCLDLDRERLRVLLRHYFEKEGMECDWQTVQNTPDGKLITCLAMVCPFDAAQKQELLEAPCGKTRAGMFIRMLEVAVCDGKACASQQH